MTDEPVPETSAVPPAFDARTRVETMTRGDDFTWVTELMAQQRDSILERWLEAAAAQPFHASQPERAVADHIPALIDALVRVLRRTSSPADNAGASVHEPAVLANAENHARARVAQGLTASDVVTEFRLLRQEIGWALRSHVADIAPTSDVLGAEILLHDALDDAAFVAVFAIDEHEVEVRRLREALMADQQRLSALLEQLPAAVMIVDAASGQVALGHPKVEQITRRAGVPVPAGDDPNEWQGFHRNGRRYAPEDWPLARAVRTGEVVSGEEIDYLRDDGLRGTVSVNAAPVRNAAGAVVAGVAIFTDVTDRKTLEQEKEAFLTAITHDLQNLLTVIKGTAGLLARQAAREPIPVDRLLERLHSIDDAVSEMARQISELQDVARLRTGQGLRLHRQRVDLVTLVRNAVARQQAGTQSHEFAVVVTGLVKQELVGDWDEARMTRVVDNLLGNAVKFSPRGGLITLSVSRETNDGDGSPTQMATLRVRDQGIGIPEDEIAHIFDWFRRASNVEGEIAGTGIGLAAVRQIVELHGGTVTAESEKGQGSTFAVRLPMDGIGETST